MLPVVLVATLMAQVDLFAVNMATPAFHRELGAGSSALELIVGGYAFTYATGLITGGRMGDLLGYRRMFLGGMAAFTVASLLCGLAQSAPQLVAARLLQGLTAAAMVPQVLALITAVFRPAERPRAMSWFGVTMGTGAVLGQVLGGVLLHANVFGLGWRAIFLVNVPIGILTVAAGARLVGDVRSSRRPRFDLGGTVGISGSLALALVPLVIGRAEGWPVWSWICLALSIPAMTASILWERALMARGGQPLLDLSLFKNRTFNVGLIANVCTFGSFFSFVFVLTLVLQLGLDLDPMTAGLTFAPMSTAFAVASVMARRFVARFGGGVVVVGVVIIALGLLGVVLVTHAAGSSLTAGMLIGPMAVVGLGSGIGVPALAGAVLAGVAPTSAGAASGLLTTSQQFASAAGIAVLGGVFFAVLATSTSTSAYGSALQWEASLSLVLAIGAAFVSRALPRPRPRHAPYPRHAQSARG
jgi:MFS family permease